MQSFPPSVGRLFHGAKIYMAATACYVSSATEDDYERAASKLCLWVRMQKAPTRLRSLIGDEYLQVAALHRAALMLIMSDALRRHAARALLKILLLAMLLAFQVCSAAELYKACRSMQEFFIYECLYCVE